MVAKYDHLMDDRIPVQKCAKIVKALLFSRLHVMVLHRYHNSVVSPMPDRLRQIMLTAGVRMLETAIALETLPEVQRWSWYGGAFQQYHVAFLLLMEMYVYPHRKEADRIWPCLDYVFETRPEEERAVKARKILSELQRKTAVYQGMRGMRAPVTMYKHVGQRPARPTELKDSLSPEPAFTTSSPVPESSSIGKAPFQDMVFAGVSNGESLWALPNRGSPETSSDSGSLPQRPSLVPPAVGDNLMADIDWVSEVELRNFDSRSFADICCRKHLMRCSLLASRILHFRSQCSRALLGLSYMAAMQDKREPMDDR